MRILPVKSKKGITLVETVLAVVVLGIFATGILTLLTAGSSKIAQTSREAAAHAEATRQMDLILSAISNGGSYLVVGTDPSLEEGQQSLTLDPDAMKTTLGLDAGTTIAITSTALYDASQGEIVSNVRGWYLELTYQGETVTGFASNTQGVFDLG